MTLAEMSLETLLLGIAVLAVFLLFLMEKSSKKTSAHLKPLPGPIGLPFIGSIITVGRFKKPWNAFSMLRKQYGDIYGLTIGSRRCVVISNMDLIKEVLVKKGNDFANKPGTSRLDVLFRGNRNKSITFCNWSDKQKMRRKITYPLLHPRLSTMDGSRLNNILTCELQELVSSLSHFQNQALEARPFLNLTCAHIFYQFVCSKKFSSQDTLFLTVIRNYNTAFHKMFEGHAIDFMPWLEIFTNRLKELEVLSKHPRKLSEALVKEHAESIVYDQPRDLLDIYLNNLKENQESSLTLEDVEVLIEEIIGGHTVVGNMWLWALYLAAANPGVQDGIREEINRVTGGRAPTVDDRGCMPYTEATILETLRVIVSPILPHVAVTDTSINGYRVPKDTLILVNSHDINMDPLLWREPRKFLPERFLNNSGGVSKPDHFIPFGLGKRNCLGDRFATTILFMGLSTLFQNYEVSLPEGFPEPDMQDIPGIVVPRSETRLVFRRMHQK